MLSEFPLQHNDIARGLGNEDWSWAGDTLSMGIIHDILPDTACFYRVKEQHLSLGLVPSMTQRRSHLYSSDYIRSNARACNASRYLADKNDFVTQLQFPELLYRLMTEQMEIEPLISNNNKKNPWAISSQLRSLLRKSADGAAEILGALDSRKKLVLFITDDLSAIVPNVLELLGRCQSLYSHRTHQLVIVHETERDVFARPVLSDPWGTVYLTTARIRNIHATPDWFFCRLPLRILVQHPGSTLIDTGTDIFQRLCREFFKVVVSQTKRIFFARIDLVNDPLDGTLQAFSKAAEYLRQSVLYKTSKIHFLDVFNSSTAWPCTSRKIVAGPRIGESLFVDLTIREPLKQPIYHDWTIIRKPVSTSRTEGAASLYVESGGVLSARFITSSCDRALALSQEMIFLPQTIQHYDPQQNCHYFRWYDFTNVREVLDELLDRAARGHNVGLAAVIVGHTLIKRYRKSGSLWGLLTALKEDGDLGVVVTLSDDESGLSLVGTSATEQVSDALALPESLSLEQAGAAVSAEQLLTGYGVAFTGSDYLSSYRDCRSAGEIQQYMEIWRSDRSVALSIGKVTSERLMESLASDEARLWSSHVWVPSRRYFFDPQSVKACEDRALADGARSASLLPSAFTDMLAILSTRADTFVPPRELSTIQWRGPENHRNSRVTEKLRRLGEELAGGSFVLLPNLEAGGAELVGTLHLRAWKERGVNNPRIILTEGSSIVGNYEAFRKDTVNIAEIVTAISGRKYPSEFSTEERVAMLETLLEAAEPDRIFSVQSYATALLLTRAKPARRVEFAMFCPHIDEDGRVSGFQNMIPAIDRNIDAYLTDNTQFAEEISRTYGIPAEKITAISYPPDQQRIACLAGRSFGNHKSKDVLWASRIDHQKNPAILLSIAKAMPDVTFHMYGRRVMNDTDFDIGKLPINIRFHGEYASLDQLLVRQYLCFLYTSRFDGMPNVLMEMAAAGLPVVTPNVGGIADFFGVDWPGYVLDGESTESYVAVLRSVSDHECHARMIQRQEQALLARSFENLQRAIFSSQMQPHEGSRMFMEPA